MYFEFAVLFYITFTLRKNDRNMKKRILFMPLMLSASDSSSSW